MMNPSDSGDFDSLNVNGCFIVSGRVSKSAGVTCEALDVASLDVGSEAG